ncbi:MAG: hypothetical protein IKA94_05170, partial [Mogibacterium sp.]|nr:hypothetical protein [Mogibacterium sp.]
MEENREDIIQNNGEGMEPETEVSQPAAESAADDDIQYTFVVPKGEIYRDPDLEGSEAIPEPVMVEPEPAEGSDEASDPARTIVADNGRFTDEVNKALEAAAEEDGDNLFDSDDFFDTYKAADPTGKTVFIEPPVYEETGLPDDDDITYTFVVPR